MNQTVMILLLNAAVTIIVTVVTVRFTMTGYVVSQAAKNKFKTRARRYGDLVFMGLGMVLGILLLAVYTAESTPITRVTIVKISAVVSGLFVVLFTFSYNVGRLMGQASVDISEPSPKDEKNKF